MFDEFDPQMSLLDSQAETINMVCWRNLCSLIKQRFALDKIFIVQKNHLGYQVIVSANDEQCFTAGDLLTSDQIPFDTIENQSDDEVCTKLPFLDQSSSKDDTNTCSSLLTKPLYWPDMQFFGFLCLVNSIEKGLPSFLYSELSLLELALQRELVIFCQKKIISSLALRNEKTGMLNRQGFNVLAAQQLQLAKRLQLSTCLLLIEPSAENTKENQQQHFLFLGNLIKQSLRLGDITAHHIGHQYVVLAFVKKEADLHSLLARIKEQMLYQNKPLRLKVGYNFNHESQKDIQQMFAEANLSKSIDNELA